MEVFKRIDSFLNFRCFLVLENLDWKFDNGTIFYEVFGIVCCFLLGYKCYDYIFEKLYFSFNYSFFLKIK